MAASIFVEVASGSGLLVPAFGQVPIGPFDIAADGLGVNVTPSDLPLNDTATWSGAGDLTWVFRNDAASGIRVQFTNLSGSDMHVNWTVYRLGP